MAGQHTFMAAALIVIFSIIIGVLTFLTRGIPLLDNRYRTPGYDRAEGLPDTDGIHLIGIDEAREFIDQGLGPVLDARQPEEYVLGHLPGAQLCHVYQLDRYLPGILDKYALDRPLLIYCTGEKCEDSRFLAQSLEEVGFKRLYIYTGGFSQWSQAGLAVEKGLESGSMVAEAQGTEISSFDLSRRMPGWFWFSVDMILLVLGLAVFAIFLGGNTNPVLFGPALRLVGLIFIAASLHKLAAPQEFARAVYNYHLLPWYAVNAAAMIFPWIELLCGICLLAGVFREPAALLIASLTGMFIMAIGINLVRGLDFDCGCFGGGDAPHWRVLARDAGILMVCLPALPGVRERFNRSGNGAEKPYLQ